MGGAPFHFLRGKPLMSVAIVIQVLASTAATISYVNSARRSISDVLWDYFHRIKNILGDAEDADIG